MSLGVIFGPERNERCTLCPLTRILTDFPPTSTTSTLFTTNFFATAAPLPTLPLSPTPPSPACGGGRGRGRGLAPRSAIISGPASTAASSLAQGRRILT